MASAPSSLDHPHREMVLPPRKNLYGEANVECVGLETPRGLRKGIGIGRDGKPRQIDAKGGNWVYNADCLESKKEMPALELRNCEALEAQLGHVFGRGRVTILHRSPSDYQSTFPCEIIVCRLADGEERSVFCKHGTSYETLTYGHKNGVAYEAAVYREVLQYLPLTMPRFYGDFTDPARGETWLVIEYLSNCARLSLASDSETAMAQSAKWIAEFHARNGTQFRQDSVPFLQAYDREYFLGWARRTAQFGAPLEKRYPWLSQLCVGFEEVADLLLRAPRTMIHGEYYPGNILIRGGSAYPVDWESAAVGAGEIDLASLIEGWSPEFVRRCVAEYQKARWPDGGVPTDFDRLLDSASLYLILRWTGERQEWTTGGGSTWLFEQLRSLGERLGIVAGDH